MLRAALATTLVLGCTVAVEARAVVVTYDFAGSGNYLDMNTTFDHLEGEPRGVARPETFSGWFTLDIDDAIAVPPNGDPGSASFSGGEVRIVDAYVEWSNGTWVPHSVANETERTNVAFAFDDASLTGEAFEGYVTDRLDVSSASRARYEAQERDEDAAFIRLIRYTSEPEAPVNWLDGVAFRDLGLAPAGSGPSLNSLAAGDVSYRYSGGSGLTTRTGYQVEIDLTRMTSRAAQVPEPGTLGLGLASLAFVLAYAYSPRKAGRSRVL